MMGATTLGSPDANKNLNGTKKTITDFFPKSPQNSPSVESKPKDLFSLFSKTGKTNSHNSKSSVTEDLSQTASILHSNKKEIPTKTQGNSAETKNKKRKLNGKEALAISNSVEGRHDDDDDSGESSSKSKRLKNNKNADKFQKDIGFLVKDKNLNSAASKNLNSENLSMENSKKTSSTDSKEANSKKTEGKSVRRSLAKPKRLDGKINLYDWPKPLDLASSDEKNAETDLTPDSCDNDFGTETDPPKSLELSYEEFLLTQETEIGSESENAKVESETAEDQVERSNDAIVVASSEKTTKPFSIATFFSSMKKSDSQKVTVMADIHPEPHERASSPKPKKLKQQKTREIVLKTMSPNAKSSLKEIDKIVVLETKTSSDAKTELTPKETKEKSNKNVSSSSDQGKNKNSGKAKHLNKDGKSSGTLLDFATNKTKIPKVEDKASTTLDANSSDESTLASSVLENRPGSEIQDKKSDSEDSSAKIIQESVEGKVPLKRKRGRPRKNSTGKMMLVNPPEKTLKKVEEQDDVVESRVSVPKIKEKKCLIQTNKNDSEEMESFPVEETCSKHPKKEILNEDETYVESKESLQLSNDENSTLGTRRSARLREHKSSPSPPSSTVEVTSPPVTAAKNRRGRKKSDPSCTAIPKESMLKEEPNMQPKVDPDKLAPIFFLKKKEKEKPTTTVIDSETLKLRRAFLMSGLSGEAKKQQQQQNNALMSAVAVDYPPIPTDCHIQQRPSLEENAHSLGVDVWNLPEASLTRLSMTDDDSLGEIQTPQWVCPSSLFKTLQKDDYIKSSNYKNFPRGCQDVPNSLSESEINGAIEALSSANPSYPVKRFYDMARSKNKAKTDGGKTVKSIEKTNESPNASDSSCVPVKGSKGSTRRSLGRRKNTRKVALKPDVAEEKKEDKKDQNELTIEDKSCDILWTEKYQPQHSVEVISNCANVKKLKSWLIEWKQKTDKELRKLRKLLQKQRKNKKSKEEDSNSTCSWIDDDSNFEVSSSENEDDSLCNTMLLTGPHGVGKTSTIYALAAELGYQIFEVNASSARTGKKILTQLQEATQSHQVSKDKTEQMTNEEGLQFKNHLTNSIKGNVMINPQKKMEQASFANFFKSSNFNKTQILEKEKSERENSRKKQSSASCKNKSNKLSQKPDLNDCSSNSTFDTNADKIKKRVNLSRTSLILFDEVDVVLEEDKGFWSAIQNFMQSTKRPIILTASSTEMAEQFKSYCEHLSFRQPSNKVITTHLQTLCLAENLVTEASGISSLVSYLKGDMRSCLLNLQFWVCSGGDFKLKRPKNNCNNDDDDIQDGCQSDEKLEENIFVKKESNLNDLTKKEYLQHQHCLESCCLGLNPDHLKCFFNDDLLNLSFNAVSWEDLTSIFQHTYRNQCFLLHQLFPSKLPLPRKSFPPLPKWKVKPVQKPDRASIPKDLFAIDSALYDSETSQDEPIFLSSTKPNDDANTQTIGSSQETEANPCESHALSLQTESVYVETSNLPLSQEATSPPVIIQPKDVSRQRNCENQILNSMAKFYECCSHNDIFLASYGCNEALVSVSPHSALSHSSLSAGLWDELPMEDEVTERLHSSMDMAIDIAANLELRTYVNCLQNISKSAKNVVEGCESFISIAPQQQCSQLIYLQPSEQSLNMSKQKAVENILHNIPLSSGFQRNFLYVDYLPMLRDVCRAEKIRQLAKMKRRFFHYFDSIGFPLRESTLNILASEFT